MLHLYKQVSFDNLPLVRKLQAQLPSPQQTLSDDLPDTPLLESTSVDTQHSRRQSELIQGCNPGSDLGQALEGNQDVFDI